MPIVQSDIHHQNSIKSSCCLASWEPSLASPHPPLKLIIIMTIDSVSRFESSEIRSDVGIEPSWQTVAARRKADINSAIPPGYVVSPTLLQGRSFTTLPETSGILTARELSIVSSTAIQLLKSIHDRALTSVEVTTAFCKSAAIAHQVVSSDFWGFLGIIS